MVNDFDGNYEKIMHSCIQKSSSVYHLAKLSITWFPAYLNFTYHKPRISFMHPNNLESGLAQRGSTSKDDCIDSCKHGKGHSFNSS